MKIDLEGMGVLLTGASRGIGAATARVLLEAGARVALHHNTGSAEVEVLARAHPGRAFPLRADLADDQQVPRLAREAANALGRIDALVNNAGIFEAADPLGPDDAWLANWDRTLAVNLRSAAYLGKLLLPGFLRQGQGRFVFVASRAAFRGDTPDHLAYAASKAGMVALSRSLARGYGKQGIKSFVVAPGFTNTRMADDFIRAHGPQSVLADNALPTLTQPEDIAPTVLFLCSGLMDHATGCSIDLNAASYVR